MTYNPNADHGAPSWVAHNGKDPAAARKFYEKVLGWNVVDMPMQDGNAYPGIMIGEKPVGGFSPMPSNDGHWLVYITVDDVDARYAAAIAAGATSVAEPFEVPEVGRMATITDPFGAHLAFIKYPS